MHAALRARPRPFPFGGALALSLVLHALVLDLPRPEPHDHGLAHGGPLAVQLPPTAEVPAMQTGPGPAPGTPQPRQRAIPAAAAKSSSHTAPLPALPRHADPPLAPSSAPVSPGRADVPLAAASALPAAPGQGAAPRAPAKESPPANPAEFTAAYLGNPKPPYPLSARRNEEAGTAVLKVLVTPEGLAGRVELERSSGFDTLDRSALETVKRWRFKPATRGGEPLAAWVRVPIEFRLEN